MVAKRIICGALEDITRGANHYYSSALAIPPYWAKGKKPTLKIGKQKEATDISNYNNEKTIIKNFDEKKK